MLDAMHDATRDVLMLLACILNIIILLFTQDIRYIHRRLAFGTRTAKAAA